MVRGTFKISYKHYLLGGNDVRKNTNCICSPSASLHLEKIPYFYQWKCRNQVFSRVKWRSKFVTDFYAKYFGISTVSTSFNHFDSRDFQDQGVNVENQGILDPWATEEEMGPKDEKELLAHKLELAIAVFEVLLDHQVHRVDQPWLSDFGRSDTGVIDQVRKTKGENQTVNFSTFKILVLTKVKVVKNIMTSICIWV